MKSPLHILHLEDDPKDAALVKSTLQAGGIACETTRVQTEDDFVAVLEHGGIDLILSDCALPTFDGMAALEIAHAGWPTIPLIFVSGTIGEERAVDSLKNGATDYVLKGHLVRLGPAVRRAMEEVAMRDERKRAETALVWLAAIVESSDDAIIGKDLNSIITSWNKGAERIFGYSADEMVGSTIMQLIPADRQDEENQFLARIRRGESVQQFETMRQAKDGRRLDVSVTVSPIKDASGNVIGISKVARDITERKRIEARFRRLLNSNAQGVLFFNTTGEVTAANDSFLHLVGYTRADLEAGYIGWSAMTPPEYASLDSQALDQIAAGGSCVPYEKEFIRKDGGRVPILVGAAAFEDNPDEGVCFVLDLTERKKLEQQFRQSQKMDAIGQLAGGVAHDFNNILAVIQLQADLLKTDGNPSQVDFAEEIGAAAQRAAGLTRQLLLFSRKETLQLHDLDLNESINGMTKMLRRTIGEDIQIQFKFAMQSLFIHADAGMMDQVLMNLAVNARDAMLKGGQLVIETSAVDFPESGNGPSVQSRPGSFVCLSVSDTGCGIRPEHLPKIFEPFFTTKDIGKGTGIGLATVFGIVQQHQGWINVSSEVGRGTTFRIYLPRLAKLSRQKTEPPALTKMRGGNETILLAEDDVSLRASVSETLSRLGYRVLEAGSGIEALEVWKQHRDEIHLLLTDMVMPGGITGKDLGERLLKDSPRLKVIYASGYSAEVVDKDFSLKEGFNFLIKPFQSFKLARAVRERLDTTSLVAEIEI